ncbi:MAG: hypothetical protein WBW35_23770 [Xanthobacteraceae bacterium]
MSKILVALAAAASLAVGLAATATTANAQADYWNGGWHVGGDYYQPTDYGYGYLSDYGQPAGGYSAIATVAPVRTVETIETVRTIRPARIARRQIVTRQTTISQVAYPRTLYDYTGPATAIAAPTYNTAGYYNANAARPLYDYAGPATAIAAPTYNTAAGYNYGAGYARPLYDYAGPATAVAAPVYNTPAYYNYGAGYARPLYDTVMPVVAQTVVATPVSPAPFYRYVYQWNRILVVDPQTNLVVRTLPR